MYEQFLTSRLSARPIAEDDLELLRRIHGNRRAMATLSVDGCPHSIARSRELLEQYCRQWQDRQYGLWMFHDRRQGSYVGYSGLLDSNVLARPSVALAYAVTPHHWGCGYAVEMSQAVLDVAFRGMQMPEVVVYTLPLNFASRNVIRRIGFQYQDEIIHAGLPHVLYRLLDPPYDAAAVRLMDEAIS